jgi:hypothetical protein
MATALEQVMNTVPSRIGITDKSGNLQSQYQLPDYASNLGDLNSMLNGIQMDPSGMAAFRSRALDPGQSAWAKLAQQQLDNSNAQNMDDMSRQSSGALNQAMSSLATHGGASRASRERLATKGARDLLMGKQDASRQAINSQLSLNMADQQQKDDFLKALPGAEVQALQPALQKAGLWSSMATADSQGKMASNEFNVNNLLKNVGSQNDYNMDLYKEKMKAYGVDRTADAQEHSGSWICTEVDKLDPLSAEDWEALRKLKVYGLEKVPERATWYLKGADGLLSEMKAEGFDFNQLRPFVLEIVALVKEGKMDEAVKLYDDTVKALEF